MRLALAAIILLLASPAVATENYVCSNRGKQYSVVFDRDAKSLAVNGKSAQVEHVDWASQVVEIRGTIDLGNTFFWAELNNIPSIVFLKEQKIIRTDHCRYVDKPPT